MFGIVAAVSADNLGSLALGGFKESSSAYRPCRHCMATREESKNKVSLVCSVFYVVMYSHVNIVSGTTIYPTQQRNSQRTY